MLINGYNTSNDYEMLFELMREQNIICYIDYNRHSEGMEPLWDVCEAITRIYPHSIYELVSRGYCYFQATTKEKFIEKCFHNKVRFVSTLQSPQTTPTPASLLELFKLVVFETPEALHVKAKELNCGPHYKDAEDIQYLHHIAGTLYKQGCKLFYFKKAFSEEELEHLIYCDDYKEVKDKPNIYINGNHNTGVLYVVENLTKESTTWKA